ncbi:hypothetical protein BIW11_04706, partial [Tropilaelaps mercedesae]
MSLESYQLSLRSTTRVQKRSAANAVNPLNSTRESTPTKFGRPELETIIASRPSHRPAFVATSLDPWPSIGSSRYHPFNAHPQPAPDSSSSSVVEDPLTMRKYAQLGLVVISLLCVGGLLVMERRYSHMKVFLEVADMFQTSDAKLKCHEQLETLRATLEGAYLAMTHEVEPSWREVAPSRFVYSAFYREDEVIVTVLMVSSSKPDMCRLWIDSKTAVEGHPTVQVLSSAGDVLAMAVHCAGANSSNVPEMVSVGGIPIPVERVPADPTGPDEVAICLRPLDMSTGDEVELA